MTLVVVGLGRRLAGRDAPRARARRGVAGPGTAGASSSRPTPTAGGSVPSSASASSRG